MGAIAFCQSYPCLSSPDPLPSMSQAELRARAIDAFDPVDDLFGRAEEVALVEVGRKVAALSPLLREIVPTRCAGCDAM